MKILCSLEHIDTRYEQEDMFITSGTASLISHTCQTVCAVRSCE